MNRDFPDCTRGRGPSPGPKGLGMGSRIGALDRPWIGGNRSPVPPNRATAWAAPGVPRSRVGLGVGSGMASLGPCSNAL